MTVKHNDANADNNATSTVFKNTITRTTDEMLALIRALAEDDLYEFAADVDSGAGDFLASNIIRVLNGDLLAADEADWRARCIERLAEWIVGLDRVLHMPHFASGEEIEIEVRAVSSARGRLALILCGDSVERFSSDEAREIEMVPAACQGLCEYEKLVAEFESHNGPLYSGTPNRDREYALLTASKHASLAKG